MPTENQHLPKEKVSVTVGEKGYKAEIKAGNHTFILDEPKSIGGQDSGPKPEDMILSALGSCTAITLRMYADRKSWPLNKIEVNLAFEANEETAGDEEAKREISVEVLVHGPLNPEQIQRLDEIAHKCPIHKSLLPAYHIQLKTAAAAPEFQ